MKLAIYDSSLDGHRISYIKAIAVEALGRSWQTTVVLPNAARSHQAAEMLEKAIGTEALRFTEYPVPSLTRTDTLSMVKFHLLNRQAAAKSIASLKQKPDFVFLPSLDLMDKAIQFLGTPFGAIPTGGMCMRARFHMKALGIDPQLPLRVALAGSIPFRLLLSTRGMNCVTTADPTLAEYAHAKTASQFRKVKFVPEIGMENPAISRSAAKEYWGFQPDDKVILVYGAISSRKAIPDLLEAIVRSRNQGIRVLILGQTDKESTAFLNGSKAQSLIQSGKVVARTHFADQETEAAAFAASDAVWVAYHNHTSMSGVFLQAVCSNIPVIAANFGLLRWLVNNYGVGICVDPNNADATARQLEQLLTDANQYSRFKKNASLMAERHRPAKFGHAVCEAIAASL